jgi:Ca-activated chloride channel family protein
VLLTCAGLLMVACTGTTDNGSASETTLSEAESSGCVQVTIAVSSEKIELISDLAKKFNKENHRTSQGNCIFIEPSKKASGAAASALSAGWRESEDGPIPTIWSPAASSWGALVNLRLGKANQKLIVPESFDSLMATPLVIAMPKPMAQAMGYPEKPVGWNDLLTLARDPNGWSTYGHPEWGPFRLGKTNPNMSTSGLSATIAQTYAAAGKLSDLTTEDLASQAVNDFNKGIESAVVHYGDITMTFLNNWFRADRRGTALTYASAVAVEEKSLIDYNKGNPDGITDPGEVPKAPKVPLVAIYPSEGTLLSDNPLFLLDADWVDAEQKDAAEQFIDFLQTPKNQRRVLAYGFRPGNPAVSVADPIISANGVDPDQPQTLLDVPTPAVLDGLLTSWAENRKKARVLLVLDVSGSMGEGVDNNDGDTKLDLAKQATIDALESFKSEDEVGLRIFSTGLGPDQSADYLDLQPLQPIGASREALARSIDGLFPTNGTPLYTVAQAAFDDMIASYDPASINAVILLTDGANDDSDQSDDNRQRDELLASLRAKSSGENATPIRVFTVAYGANATTDALRQIAEASNAAFYSASDAATIKTVFAQVVSNF